MCQSRVWMLSLCLASAGIRDAAGHQDDPTRPERCRRVIEQSEADDSRPWAGWRTGSLALLEIAAQDPGDPASASALFWILERGSAFHDTCAYGGPSRHLEIMDRAMRMLLGHHRDDPRIGSICLELARIPSPLRDAFLGEVYATTRSREARGLACLALAEYLEMKGGVVRRHLEPMPDAFRKRLETEIYDPGYFAHLLGCSPEGLAGESAAFYREAIRQYGDVKLVRNVAGTAIGRRYAQLDGDGQKDVGDVARSRLGASVGSAAPEIEGRDADGKAFKLSDYRGKTVVLTFSGNWCAPCRGQYPAERELVRRMEGKPFALLSVSTDESATTLADSIRTGEITWRCWWDGTGGPICNRWDVQSFPMVFLIDPEGIIREKNVAAVDLADRVERMIQAARP